ERTVVTLIGVAVLYSLLVLFGQFLAQGVVEEKASRVVELLLATLRPWQLLAGKILGLGLLGLAQIVVIAGVGVAGALAFDVMPVRMAAGEAAAWEVAVAVVLMLVAIALVVRLGGRIYAGALLRTGGKIKLREALAAERV